MTKTNNRMHNMSMAIYAENCRLGDLIHWRNASMIESWHYREQYETGKIFIDIAMFSEQDLEYAIAWAKFGDETSAKEHAISVHLGQSYPGNGNDTQMEKQRG